MQAKIHLYTQSNSFYLMTELTNILEKSYEKLKKILRKTYDELTKKLRNAKKGLEN